MKKKIASVALVLIMVLSISTIAQARLVKPITTLKFSGTTANCSVTVISGSDEIEATMELWHGSTLVDSWSGSDVGVLTIEGSCRVTKGQTYYLVVSGTAGGRSFTTEPHYGTC